MHNLADHKKAEKEFLPEKLLKAGLRPTRQRLLLAQILFDGTPKHVTAEQVMAIVRKRRGQVSLATVYNTLNQFTKAGLLREVSVDSTKAYFDTVLCEHHHFFDGETGQLFDIPEEGLRIESLPRPPSGKSISRIDVTIHLSSKGKGSE